MLNKKMTKSEITNYYVNGLLEEFSGDTLDARSAKKIVAAQMEMFEELMQMHLSDKGCPGQFTVPGLFTIKAMFKPAVKGGDLVRSPASGEMVTRKPKDASVRVKIVPMKKCKDIAQAGIATHKSRGKQLAAAKAAKIAEVKAPSRQRAAK